MAVKILVLFLTVVVAVTSACNMMAIPECNKHDLVSEFKFHGFIPRDKLQETCGNMKIVLDCIYQPKYFDGCTTGQTFFYDMQRDVSNAVCNDKAEYLKHADCFGNQELADKVQSDCLGDISIDENCEPLVHARTCMTSAVLGKCGQKDSDYMDLLAYYMLGSLSKLKACTMDLPEMLKEKKDISTKPVTMATSGKPTKVTSAMATTSQPTETTTKSGCSHTGYSLLAMLSLFAVTVTIIRPW